MQSDPKAYVLNCYAIIPLGNPTPWLKVFYSLGSASSLQLASPLPSLLSGAPTELSHASLAIPLASFHFMRASTQRQGRTT